MLAAPPVGPAVGVAATAALAGAAGAAPGVSAPSIAPAIWLPMPTPAARLAPIAASPPPSLAAAIGIALAVWNWV